MPATRSRTEHWRRSLEQLASRQGGLEISVPRPENHARHPEPSASGGDLIWRCRVYDVNDHEIVIEHPVMLGRPVDFAPGVGIVAIIAIGQNRWMFRTKVLGFTTATDARGRRRRVRLAAPDDVERCQRDRSTVSRPWDFVCRTSRSVPCSIPARWFPPGNREPGRDPRPAQRGDRQRIGRGVQEILLPEVGPPFYSTLVNIGGGGVGLMVDPLETQSRSGPYFWLRLNLLPQIPRRWA